MATPSPLQAFHNVGNLSAALSGQTYDLSTAYPHGGTALGLKRGVQIKRTEGREIIRAEEFGVETYDTIYTSEQWLIAFSIRGFDEDAISALFPNTATGSSSGKKGIVHPGSSLVAGHLQNSRAVKLLFTPGDSVNHPAVYFPNAFPEVAEELQIGFGRPNEFLITVGFRAVRASSADGRACQVMLLKDLTV